jgi:G6PDH family F420-dependent oxidoreductase
MLEEAIEIMRSLWSGGFHSHHGKHFTVEDARIYTLPEQPPPVHVAVSGSASVALASRSADGMVATQPRSELTRDFDRSTGGTKPKYGQLAVSVDEDEATARRLAHERFRFSAPGWKVTSELPNPINFEAATAHVTEDDMAELVSCGPDPELTWRRSESGQRRGSTASRSCRSGTPSASSRAGSASCGRG